MSFLNLISGGRRTPAPPQSTSATARVEAARAHLSQPSRQASIDSLAPAARSRNRPSRAQTDSASFSTQSSRSSAVPSTKKPFVGGQGAGPSLPPSVSLSPAASELSLVDTLGDDTALQEAQSHSGTSIVFPKAPTSLEQEWMEVENDSSDEDDFLSDDGHRAKDSSKPSKALNESVVMVEDEHVKARRLAEELATTQETLSEIRTQQSTLQRHLESLEKENQAKASQLKLMKETNDSDKIKVAREHAAALDMKRRELHDFQRSLETLQRELKAYEEKIEMLVQENEVLRKEVASLEKQSRREEEGVEAMKREVEAANTALRTFKERSKALVATEREENAKLKARAGELQRQLEALGECIKESNDELHRLRGAFESSEDALRVAQAAASEKDRALCEAQRQIDALEKQKEALHEKVVEMETEIIEARNAAQRLLAKATEDHQQKISQGNDRIESLEDELNTYSTTIQQLRTSLRASRAEAEGTTKVSENRAAEIERLQQQISFLEDELHSKEQDLIDANAGRTSQSHLEDKIRNLNMTVERLKSDHAVENHHLDVQLSKERARISQLEKEVSASHDRHKELRSRLEMSEQSRRMLRDQLTRRNEETGKDRRDSGGINLSSSIIQDPAQSPNDQVYNLLRNLNYEIFQTAALLADSLCNIPRPSSSNSNPSELIDQETTSLLGPFLLALVQSQTTVPLDSYDPYPLQTAIQATLVCCSTRVMTAWYPGHWDHSDFLASTYIRIREAEGIAASDSWKAMTRARLRPTTTTVARVVDFLEECLDTIFRYAGWPAVNTAATSSSSSGPTLSALARHTLRLNVLLDSVNPQLEPAFVEPGSIFDPYVMDRDDGVSESHSSEDDDEVVSTSEIGLRKVGIEGIGGSSSSSSTHRRRIVLRPKVILKSSFEA
ncbi:hypothetical protein D9756_005711 [Leucocoprinus leucothites]|uniref:Uncharacterized protein n=1 Tax=Leucocoprinus leucothites TaxID=201217 RepID=A0A8H5D7V5_9AGAR|nr:hypothetical protein D9756_005711 [Leucoagaricus leucothites]